MAKTKKITQSAIELIEINKIISNLLQKISKEADNIEHTNTKILIDQLEKMIKLRKLIEPPEAIKPPPTLAERNKEKEKLMAILHERLKRMRESQEEFNQET